MVSVEDLKYSFLEFPLEKNSFYKDPEVIKYLEEIKKYKRLDKEEERKLLEQKEHEKVFHANLLMAATIAGRFSLLTKSIYPMDLIQEANIRLLEAIKKYNIESKTDFTHYLRISIHRNLISMLKTEGKMFGISKEDYEKIIGYSKILELEESIDSEKYNEELSRMWEQFEKYYGNDYSSYIQMLNDLPLLKSARDEVISLDTINKEEALGTYDIEDDINCMFDGLLVSQIIKEIKLSENEKMVLYLLYFSKNRYNEIKIAKKLRVSRSRINYIKKMLLLKIKYIFTHQSKIDTLNKKKVLK